MNVNDINKNITDIVSISYFEKTKGIKSRAKRLLNLKKNGEILEKLISKIKDINKNLDWITDNERKNKISKAIENISNNVDAFVTKPSIIIRLYDSVFPNSDGAKKRKKKLKEVEKTKNELKNASSQVIKNIEDEKAKKEGKKGKKFFSNAKESIIKLAKTQSIYAFENALLCDNNFNKNAGKLVAELVSKLYENEQTVTIFQNFHNKVESLMKKGEPVLQRIKENLKEKDPKFQDYEGQISLSFLRAFLVGAQNYITDEQSGKLILFIDKLDKTFDTKWDLDVQANVTQLISANQSLKEDAARLHS